MLESRTSASGAEPTASAAAMEFFEKQVRPLLANRCLECHSTAKAKGGLVLETNAGWKTGGDTGPAIEPGNPDASLLVRAVRYTDGDLQMPPKGILPAEEIALFEKWVAMGAPDPRGSADAPQSAKPTGMTLEEGLAFWSFRPVADPPIPTVRDRAWVRTPIDAFVLARLEAQGLRPAPSADKRTLIRRVTFDLIGLPPTPAEINAFLEDNSPNAFEKVVERLLASPQHGVRWGRHWLDVARYADSNGLDENLAFGNAWRYRDWVVDAFNADKPVDRFVIEQVAGDLLPDADLKTRTATGFLVLGAKVLAEPDRGKLEMDTIDEQIDTLGKAFLGMTLGCVRCHDHKFDPFTQADYYSLAAIFKSTKTFGETQTGVIKHWNEYPFGTAEELEGLKAVDAQIDAKKASATKFRNEAMERIRTQARQKAAEYLSAAARFEPDAPLTQVETIARPLGLHPRILHHCRRHLDFHRDDPLFETWHALRRAGDVAGIETHYRDVFARMASAWGEAQKADPKPTALADARLERARQALQDTSGFLAVPPKPEFAFDADTLAEYHRLAEEARLAESVAPDVPAAMAVSDGAVVASLPIHVRGSHRNLGEPVERGFPAVLTSTGPAVPLPEGQSGRLQLAHWLARPENPLTMRVWVNRVWRWHFGAGIVPSTENFGRLGDRPSHPELLDWLAKTLPRAGGSTKQLHRWLVLSNTYRMASDHPDESLAFQRDPQNRLLWKFPRQRLEAEPLRDAILAVSGRLDLAIGGKSIPLRNRQFVFDHTSIDHTRYDSLRRAIYLPIVRNNVYPLFEQFDFPDPTMPTGSRHSTVVSPQALYLMNSGFVLDSALEMARSLLAEEESDGARVERATLRAFGRPPTRAETDRILAMLADLSVSGSEDDAATAEQAWTLVCQSFLASNEFLYLR